MTVAGYLASVAALAVTAGAPLVVAVRTRRRVLAQLTGPAAVLAEGVLALALLLAVAQLAGTVGLLRRWPLAGLELAGAALATALLGRWRPRVPRGAVQRDRARPVLRAEPRWAVALALAAVAAASAEWVASARRYFLTGDTKFDAVQYHLSTAAQFVQTHATTALHATAAGEGTQYYPFDSELLNAIGMFDLHTDALSLLGALFFLVGAFLAAWCMGSAIGRPAGALAGVAAVLALPDLASNSGGSATNDITGIAFLLAAVALLALAADDAAVLALVALSCGLALATKLTVAVPVVVVVTIAVWRLRRRPRAAARCLVLTAVAGGYWYLRNLARTGSPLPNLRLGTAAVHLPTAYLPFDRRFARTVASYLGQPAVWRRYFEPALRVGLGPGWLVVLLLAAVGTLGCLLVRRGPGRTLGVAALAALAGYLVTPTTAGGLTADAPILFGTNERYAIPFLCLALAALPAAVGIRRLPWFGALVGFALTARTVSAASSWPGGQRSTAELAVAVLLVAGVAALTRLGRRGRAWLLVGCLLAATAAGLPLIQRFEQHRYAGGTPLDRLWALGREVSHRRIGVLGLPEEYPLYGPTWTNQVDYLGRAVGLGAVVDYTSCTALLVAASRSGDRYVVVFDEPGLPPYPAWLRAGGAAIVLADRAGVVLRLPRGPRPDGCR